MTEPSDAEIELLANEAEHGYDVSSGRPRPFPCCTYVDHEGACACPEPVHAGDPRHPFAVPEGQGSAPPD